MDMHAGPDLYLTEKIYVALTDGVLVFLDLRNDRYSCLERRHTAAVSAMLGLPAPVPRACDVADPGDAERRVRMARCAQSEFARRSGPIDNSGSVGSSSDSVDTGVEVKTEEAGETGRKELEDLVAGMIDRGFATRDAGAGKRAAFVSQFDELREMPGYPPREGPKVRAGDVANFFRAFVTAKLLLKLSTLERIAKRMKRRRERAVTALRGEVNPAMQQTSQTAARTPAQTGCEEDRVNEIVEIFKILKPLVVSVKDRCLFNSLFLIEFLACYRIYPDWWFGVRLNEFYAHCWVQSGNVIFDDFIQNTSANEPIMVV